MIDYQDYLAKMPRGEGNRKAYFFDKITSAFIKSKQTPIKNPKNILVIRNDHIGDMILATPIFREIKEAFPHAKLTVLADPVNKTIIEKDKYVDEIIEIGLFWRKRNLKSFQKYLQVLKKIKEKNFDLGIDLRGSRPNILFFLFIPGIKTRVSYYNSSGGKAFLTNPVLYEKTFAHRGSLKLLKSIGIKVKGYLPHIMTDKEDEKDVSKFLKENKLKKFVIFCPGTTTEAKQWPIKKFRELIEVFSKKYKNYKIIAASGPEDKEMVKNLCQNKNCIPLAGYNLRKLVLIFKKAKLAIAPDGGVREIASVAGTNLIALCGPVDLSMHVPFRYFRILHHQLPCYPCAWSKPCQKPCGKWCMDLITVEEVMKAIDEIMRKKPQKTNKKNMLPNYT